MPDIDKDRLEQIAIKQLELINNALETEILYLMSSEEVNEQLREIGVTPGSISHIRGLVKKATERSRSEGRAIQETLHRLFGAVEEENFEGGVQNELVKHLDDLLAEHGVDLIDGLERFIVFEQLNEETAAEVLRWIGRLPHGPTVNARLDLLVEGLQNSSARVRDAAAVAMAALDDPKAIPYVRDAIEAETCSELREDMKQILDQLETTQKCPSS